MGISAPVNWANIRNKPTTSAGFGITDATPTRGTAVASTAGVAVDFVGIPAGVSRVTVLLSGVSSAGSSPFQIQLGTSAGVVTAGYAGGGDAFSASPGLTLRTNGLALMNQNAATAVHHVRAVLELVSGTTWLCTSAGMRSDTTIQEYGVCSITLPGTLDRVRLTSWTGVDTFDAGTVNIIFE